MADWIDQGTIAPAPNGWQYFNQPLVGGEVFRVRQENGIQVEWGYCLLAFRWDLGSSSGKYGFRRIYPRYRADEIEEIFISPIPPQLAELNVVVRYAGLYLPRWVPYVTNPASRWRISLDSLLYEPSAGGGSGGTGGGGDDGGVG